MAAPELWTIGRLLAATSQFLAQRRIDSARLDAELLIAHVLKATRLHLYTHHDQPVTDQERDTLRNLVRRRAQYEPMAYICGDKEFYGHRFIVNRDVLVPRPETEGLVEVALAFLRNRSGPVTLLDVGTGSGAVAISVALAHPDVEVLACDISAAALAVAQQNVALHKLQDRVTLRQIDLSKLPLPEQAHDVGLGLPPFAAIVANLPYIGAHERSTLPPDVLQHEPHLALFADDEGTALNHHLCRWAMGALAPGGLLAFEIGAGQKAAALTFLQPYTGARVDNDLAGMPRVAIGFAP